MANLWKKGRGKLGPFVPLHGAWVAEADSDRGRVRCRRVLTPILGGHYLRLLARWEFGPSGTGRVYEEEAVIGAGDDGVVCFWSFTSDGKRSQGALADVTDLHPEAVGFEADMPAGRARMAYWPVEGGGFRWVVESKTRKGWNRFVDHTYCTAPDAEPGATAARRGA
jgi:WD40 repeat protein